MIKAILFDLGDTIFKPDWNSMNKKMIEETGVSIFMPNDIKKKYNEEVLIGKSSMESIFELIMKNSNIQDNIKNIIEAYKRNYKKFSPINIKMISLIKKLRNKYKTFALSNTNLIHKEVNVKRGLFENFNQIFLSFEIGLRKPDKRIFSIILDKTKFLPEEILFIDDNEENINKAKEIGFIGLRYENYNKLITDLKQLGLD